MPLLRCCIVVATMVIGPCMCVAQEQPLHLVQTIAMPNVKGRIDHMDVDLRTSRLFVAGLDNGSVEVLDLKAGKWLQTIPGFKKPQGILYLHSLNKLFVASGDDGMLRVFRGDTLQPLADIHLRPGPNRLIFNPHTREVYVGYGGKDAGEVYGEVGVIDSTKYQVITNIKVAAHPAELLLQQSGQRLYVLVPAATQIQVVDTKARHVTSTWPTSSGRPGDGALDDLTHRIFVGTRKPAQLLVLDSDSGKEVVALPTIDGMDGIYFNSKQKRIYVSGSSASDSSVWVYQQQDPGKYTLMAKVPTREGAATALWVPELNRYYIAAPASGGTDAAVLVFEPEK